MYIPAGMLYKSTAGRYRPDRVADGPIMARCRFMWNAYWDTICLLFYIVYFAHICVFVLISFLLLHVVNFKIYRQCFNKSW